MALHLCRRFVTPLALILGMQIGSISPGWGQQPGSVTDPRRAAVDGILRNLVDNEMGWYGSAPQAAPTGVSAKMNQARQLLRSFSTEGTALVNTLQSEARYSYEARPLLGEALTLLSTVNVLAQRSQYLSEVDQLANDLASLDGDWRVLAHRLRQARTLGLAVTKHVEKLDGLSQQLAGVLQIDPQMQTDDLGDAFADLDSELDHLVQDIKVDLVNLPSQRQLDSEIRRLQSWVRHLRQMVTARRPFTEVKTQYQSFNDAWMPTKAKLRQVSNRHLQRSVTQVNVVNQRVQELLLMPRVIDGNDVLYMATVLKENVDMIGDRVSLRRLIALPNAAEVFARVSEFYTLSGDFRQAVVTKFTLEDLLFDYNVLEVAWQDLRLVLDPLASPDTAEQMEIVEASLNDLRNALGIQSSVNQNETLELASSLSNMTDLLHYDMTRYVGRGSYDGQFRTAATNATNQLRSSAKTLHDQVTARTPEVQIRQQCQQLALRWNELQPYVARVSAADRAEIVRTCQQIAPMVAKLQVLYAY